MLLGNLWRCVFGQKISAGKKWFLKKKKIIRQHKIIQIYCIRRKITRINQITSVTSETNRKLQTVHTQPYENWPRHLTACTLLLHGYLRLTEGDTCTIRLYYTRRELFCVRHGFYSASHKDNNVHSSDSNEVIPRVRTSRPSENSNVHKKKKTNSD